MKYLVMMICFSMFIPSAYAGCSQFIKGGFFRDDIKISTPIIDTYFCDFDKQDTCEAGLYYDENDCKENGRYCKDKAYPGWVDVLYVKKGNKVTIEKITGLNNLEMVFPEVSYDKHMQNVSRKIINKISFDLISDQSRRNIYSPVFLNFRGKKYEMNCFQNQ